MYIFLIVSHILAAILLITVVLIQRGRGGGLVESFSGMESMFGTKTSVFLTRITAVLATIFLVTSISLALIAARRTRSLIDEEAISAVQEEEAMDEGQPIEPMTQVPVSPVQEKELEDKKPIERSPAPSVAVETVQE